MDPFIGQIQPYGFNFAPRGWATCDGQIMPINQNQALYSLLGTIYGGDGRTTFALPDLRGRTPIHQGTNNASGMDYSIGQRGGAETTSMSVAQLPGHVHVVDMPVSNNAADSDEASGGFLTDQSADTYATAATPNSFYGSGVNTASTGNGAAYNIMQPFLTINMCIATVGLFPSRN